MNLKMSSSYFLLGVFLLTVVILHSAPVVSRDETSDCASTELRNCTNNVDGEVLQEINLVANVTDNIHNYNSTNAMQVAKFMLNVFKLDIAKIPEKIEGPSVLDLPINDTPAIMNAVFENLHIGEEPENDLPRVEPEMQEEEDLLFYLLIEIGILAGIIVGLACCMFYPCEFTHGISTKHIEEQPANSNESTQMTPKEERQVDDVDAHASKQ